MTLYRRLVITITLLMACLMAGNLYVTVINARGYQFEQMQIHARDAATSLGMILTHAAESQDQAQVQTFINAFFDSSYYQSISYRSFGGGVRVEARMPFVAEGVPGWFIDLVRLPQTMGSAEVMSGWRRLGVVNVESNTGPGYRELWSTFIGQCWLFALATMLAYTLAGITLYFLLKPLRRVEAQANAICQREFELQPELPATPELRRVVQAMNRMVGKLQSIFSDQIELARELHEQAHLDPVSGLSNRSDFNSRFNAFLKSERAGSPAALLLLHVDGLSDFNAVAGRALCNDNLAALGATLADFFEDQDEAIPARLSGSDFVVFLPFVQQQEAREQFQQLFTRLAAAHWLESSPALGLQRGLQMGLQMGATFTEAAMLGNSLLQEADLALRQAQMSGRIGLCWADAESGAVARNAGDWRELLLSALRDERLTFFLQPACASGSGELLQHEVLCRLYVEDSCLTAGVLLPMAERHNLAIDVDRYMLQRVARCNSLPDVGLIAVNLSPRSVLNEDFMSWLVDFLQQNPALSQRLLLELPETCLAGGVDIIRDLHHRAAPMGVRLSLDHFGAGSSAFHYLQSLPLAFLKLQRRFIETVEDSEDSRFYIRSLLQFVHACDLMLLAEGVESEAQWGLLQGLGIDGGQGYHLGEPHPV